MVVNICNQTKLYLTNLHVSYLRADVVYERGFSVFFIILIIIFYIMRRKEATLVREHAIYNIEAYLQSME